MKVIALKRLTLDHFKSFRAPYPIDLPADAGLTLISGDNRVEPRLGANGSGKSTLWDALCFCLYGVSVRGSRINDLVAYGGKATSVTALFEVDESEVEVSRSGPPARVHIDGKQVEQADVEALFGLSRQRFLNSVVFGQAVPLFVDLPIPARGDLLDEVLDLQMWMRAAELAGKRLTAANAELNALKVEIGRTEGAIGSLEDPEELKSLAAGWETSREERRDGLLGSIREGERDVKNLTKSLNDLEGVKTADPKALYNKLQAWQREQSDLRSQLAVISSQVERITEDMVFFRDNRLCPSCEQEITPELAERHAAEHEAELREAKAKHQDVERKLGVASETSKVVQRQWQEADAARQTSEADKARIKVQVQARDREMASLERQVEQLDGEENPHEVRLARSREVRKSLRVKLRDLKRQERGIVGRSGQLEFWRQGFRRVRLYCIDRVLRQLEIETMNAADSLGLAGWKIRYATETETRSGTAKMGVQVEVNSPTMSGPFASWSGGEGQRIRLCTALGFAGLIQRWAGVRWGFEVFDEPTAWLSEAGIEDLLDLLKNRADAQRKRIFLCDHRGLQHAGFDSVITIAKDARGSFVDGNPR